MYSIRVLIDGGWKLDFNRNDRGGKSSELRCGQDIFSKVTQHPHRRVPVNSKKIGLCSAAALVRAASISLSQATGVGAVSGVVSSAAATGCVQGVPKAKASAARMSG